MAKLEGQVRITRDGEIQIRTTNGTFTEGKATVEQIISLLVDLGIYDDGTPKPNGVEQHVHKVGDVAHTHTHAGPEHAH